MWELKDRTIGIWKKKKRDEDKKDQDDISQREIEVDPQFIEKEVSQKLFIISK